MVPTYSITSRPRDRARWHEITTVILPTATAALDLVERLIKTGHQVVVNQGRISFPELSERADQESDPKAETRCDLP